MLNEVIRQAMARVHNRFHLAVIAAQRASQLLQGARPTVDNSRRERVMKVALREIAEDHIVRDNENWKVVRPPSAFEQVFSLPTPDQTAEAGLALGGEPAGSNEEE